MENKNVIKRDERIQKYDWSKIENAVGAAFKKVNQEMDDTFRNQLRKSVESAFKNANAVSVEEIIAQTQLQCKKNAAQPPVECPINRPLNKKREKING